MLAAAYLALRLPVLLLHELHNDEVIFMQFSQLMRQDWREYWWMSVDGRAGAAAQGRGLSFLFETRGSARRWTSELMLDPRLCRERVIFTKVWRGRELDESRRVLCTAAP